MIQFILSHTKSAQSLLIKLPLKVFPLDYQNKNVFPHNLSVYQDFFIKLTLQIIIFRCKPWQPTSSYTTHVHPVHFPGKLPR